jgi:hypothetical protein
MYLLLRSQLELSEPANLDVGLILINTRGEDKSIPEAQ